MQYAIRKNIGQAYKVEDGVLLGRALMADGTENNEWYEAFNDGVDYSEIVEGGLSYASLLIGVCEELEYTLTEQDIALIHKSHEELVVHMIS
jgi:hypothetical protein